MASRDGSAAPAPAPDGPADASAALAARLRGGDRAAWEEAYLRHRDALLFAVRCRLGPALRERLTSEDVLQSVVADALSDVRRFEHRGPGSLRRWLAACVVNKLRAKAQRFAVPGRALAVPLADSVPDRAGPPRYLDAERWEPLERALGELDQVQREVVLLRALDGLSNAEAAARVARSPEATSKLYNRALARLGARLADLAPGGGR